MLSININDYTGLVKSSYVVQVFYNTVLFFVDSVKSVLANSELFHRCRYFVSVVMNFC